jgi:Domain of unknown function (DUF4376)
VQDANNNWVYAWTITDHTAEQIAAALAQAKLSKNADIDKWREQANSTSFVHDNLIIACDPLSRSDIDGTAGHIALFGSFPPNFPGAWKGKTAEGATGYVMLPTIEAFKALYSSMTAQGSANFNHSQQLKQSLASATTVTQVNAITW